MLRVPQVLGLIFCEEFGLDAARRIALSGLFQSRHFKSFPTASQEFTVYAALYGGEGEGIMELTAMHLATERNIDRYRRWHVFSDRPWVYHLGIPLRKIIFPLTGRYSFTLRFDGEIVTQR